MLRITFCAYDKPGNIGGPVTWLQLLLPALQERGFEVSCLILFHVGDTGPLVEHLREKGVPFHTSPYHFYTEDNIRWILERLQENPPHIFVPNLVVAAYYAAAWAKKAGIHTVGISHSDDPFYHAIQKEFMDGKEDFRLSGMVCVSSELENQLKASRFAPQLNIKRIPYGVNIPQAKAQRQGPDLQVVYVGRLAEEQKRISEVTSAFCSMTSQIPNTTAVIYGEGPDRDKVEAILKDKGEGLPVVLAGSLAPGQVQEALLNAHVIVLLSDYEGLPIAVLEAMACGVVPVCLAMNSGISEQIQDGVTGFIVIDREAHFIETVKVISNNPHLWETISVNAKNFISENFTIAQSHQCWIDYLNLYEKSDFTGIVIPEKIKLPPVNPALARADNRKPSSWYRMYQTIKRIFARTRIQLGAIKARIKNQKIL
jgi:colanic acid/amylovoran biosynthesis glycosyltransferase